MEARLQQLLKQKILNFNPPNSVLKRERFPKMQMQIPRPIPTNTTSNIIDFKTRKPIILNEIPKVRKSINDASPADWDRVSNITP
ncbi:MAG TPA: hypothetical protein EYP92_01255 [Candidatus Thioglobus sp.]|jgi:hypothetical protein|nr:hypothetical protein [Candidatus Thioglobus sp.]